MEVDDFNEKWQFYTSVVDRLVKKSSAVNQLFDKELAAHFLDIVSHSSTLSLEVFQHYVEQYIANCILVLDECYSLQTGKLLFKLQIDNGNKLSQKKFLCTNADGSSGNFSPPRTEGEGRRCFLSVQGCQVKGKQIKRIFKNLDVNIQSLHLETLERLKTIVEETGKRLLATEKQMRSNLFNLIEKFNEDGGKSDEVSYLYNSEYFKLDHGLASFTVEGLPMRINGYTKMKRLLDKTVLEYDGLELSKHCKDAAADAAAIKARADEAGTAQREESVKLSNAASEKRRLDRQKELQRSALEKKDLEKRQALAAQIAKSIQNGVGSNSSNSSSNSGKKSSGVKDTEKKTTRSMIPAVTQLTNSSRSDRGSSEPSLEPSSPLLSDTSAEILTGEGNTTCDDSLSTAMSTTTSSQQRVVGSSTQLTPTNRRKRRENDDDVVEDDFYTSRFLSSSPHNSRLLSSSPMSDNSEPVVQSNRQRRARRVTGDLGDKSDEETIILKTKNHRKRTASEMNSVSVSSVFPKNIVPETYQLTELQQKAPEIELHYSDLVVEIRDLLTEIEETNEEDSTPIVSKRESLMQEANKKLDTLMCKLIENDVADELLVGLRRDQNTVAYWSMKRHINQLGDSEVIHEINFVHFFKVIKDSLYERFSFKGKKTQRFIGRENFIVEEFGKLSKVEGDKNGILGRKINCILHKLGLRFVYVYNSLNIRAGCVMEYHDAAFVLSAKSSDDDDHMIFDEERIVSFLRNVDVSDEYMKEFEGLLQKKAPRDTLISMSEKEKQDKKDKAAAKATAQAEKLEKQVLDLLPAAFATGAGVSAITQRSLPSAAGTPAAGTPSSVQDSASQTVDRSTVVGAITARNAVGESLSGELSNESHDQASELLLNDLFKNSEGVSGKFKVIHSSANEVADDVRIACAKLVVLAADNLLVFDDGNIADLLCQQGGVIEELRYEVHKAVPVVGDERTSLPCDFFNTREDNFNCYRATLQVCQFAQDMSCTPPVSRPMTSYKDEDFNLDPKLLRKHLIQIQKRLKFENDSKQRLEKEALRSTRYFVDQNIKNGVSSNHKAWIDNLPVNRTTSHMLFLPERFSFWKFNNHVECPQPLADIVDGVLCLWAKLTILPFVMLKKYSIHPPLVTFDEFRDEVIMNSDLCIMQHKNHYFVAKLVGTERDVETQRDLQSNAFRNAVRAWAKGVVERLRSMTQPDIDSLLKFCKDSIARGCKVSKTNASISEDDLPGCAYSDNIQDVEANNYQDRVKSLEGFVSDRMIYYESQIEDLKKHIDDLMLKHTEDMSK